MVTVILTVHTLIVLALIGVVLLQRSEGGALGMGGGGGGGFMTGRGAANALTRTTSVLAALFFATSLGLAIFAAGDESDIEVIEGLTGEEIGDPNDPTAEDLLRTLGDEDDDGGETAGGAPSIDAGDLSEAFGDAVETEQAPASEEQSSTEPPLSEEQDDQPE